MIIVIPMAGNGKRFKEAGYEKPKPLIEIKPGITMIEAVVQSLMLPDADYVFICRRDHEQYGLCEIFNRMSIASFTIVWVDGVTEGAACSVLMASEIISVDDSIAIVNSDQMFDWCPRHFIQYTQHTDADGSILTFVVSGDDAKWSFVKLSNDSVHIEEVKEKQQISNLATAGLYYFKNGKTFVNAATEMILANDRVNSEFYVAPVYNYVIASGKKVINYPIPRIYATGTPDDLNKYKETRHWQCL